MHCNEYLKTCVRPDIYNFALSSYLSICITVSMWGSVATLPTTLEGQMYSSIMSKFALLLLVSLYTELIDGLYVAI